MWAGWLRAYITASEKALIVMLHVLPVRRLALSDNLLCKAAALFMFLMISNPIGATASSNIPTGSIRIIYTNDTVGYLEPCNCGGRYLGGLARRATAISSLVNENPRCLIVDSGNISNTRTNMGIVASLMSEMRYDAVGIGALDRNMEDEFFGCALKYGLVVVDTTSEASVSSTPYIIKDINGIKVGVVSYSTCTSGNVVPSDVLQKFYTNYRFAREKADLLILLDQGEIVAKDWQQRWAGRLGAPDVVIAGVSKMPLSQVEVVGKTHIVPTSVQGRAIGVIDVKMDTSRKINLSARQITIDKNIAEDEKVKKQIIDFINRSRTLATFSPANVNFGNVKKGVEKEVYVTLTPAGAEKFTIKKVYSTGSCVSASEWTPNPDGSYRIKVVVKASDKPGRVLETLSFKLGLSDEPMLSLLVFGNVVGEQHR